jgi:RNA-binding protein
VKGFQKKYLRGLAHGLTPVVMVGQKGLTPGVIQSVEEALNTHELIKVKFIDFKEKKDKTFLSDQILKSTGSHLVTTIGHTAIFYRPHSDPEKRKILLPERHP